MSRCAGRRSSGSRRWWRVRLGPRVHVVEGGDNRQQSVSNALAATECVEDDVVLVHDAARPLIDPATIERTIDAVVEHGAAIVGRRQWIRSSRWSGRRMGRS